VLIAYVIDVSATREAAPVADLAYIHRTSIGQNESHILVIAYLFEIFYLSFRCKIIKQKS
jgi:hypothetical protein